MMPSSWSKGSEVEKMRKKILQDEGYIVQSWPKSTFGTQDLFGAFDIIAMRLGEIRFEQVKMNSDRMPAKSKESIIAMQEAWKHICDHAGCYWVGYRADRKEWKIVKIDDPFKV